MTSGVLDFVRTAAAGAVTQYTNTAVPAGRGLGLSFTLGNRSNVRQRVTVLLVDSDFSDVLACTFWVPPGQALGAFAMRIATTKSWANAAVGFYPSTAATLATPVSALQWLQLDDVALTPTATTPLGTECFEPGAPLPSLTVAKTASAGTLTRGGTGTFTLTATNRGDTATNGTMVYVTDTLPTGLTPTTASGTGWTCTITGQAVSCTRTDALSASASYAAITVAATVASDAGASLTNTASVVGGGDSSSASGSVTVSTAAACANGGACILGDVGPGGGLVFLISGGLRYEMAPKTWGAKSDRSITNETISIQWCNDQLSNVTGAVRTEVGTGSANTTAVDAACTSGAGQSAADYSANGLSDWFLPSKDELNAMCNYSRTWTGTPSTGACTGAQNGAFAAGTYGFDYDDYWSSSQHPIITSGVWYLFVSDGSDLMGTKGNSFRVRPVRAF